MTKVNKMFNRERLFEECANGHPQITVDPALLNGIPHLKGTTLLVSEVLSRLYVHRGIREVVRYYGDITEEQVLEVISYSLKFMEIVFYKPQDTENYDRIKKIDNRAFCEFWAEEKD